MGLIGAKDEIDQALVNRYLNMKTNNLEKDQTVNPDRMWNIMNHMGMVNYSQTKIDIRSMKDKVKKVEAAANNNKRIEPIENKATA